MKMQSRWYDVVNGQIDIPPGAQIIDKRFEDRLGLGGGHTLVQVLVLVPDLPPLPGP